MSELLRIARLVPAVSILMVQDEGEFGESTVSPYRLGRKELLESIKGAECLDEIRNWDDVKDLFLDMDRGDALAIMSLEEHEKKQADKKREGLERAASEIDRRNGCKVGSFDFIAACYSELERFSTYREGMREDGLCIGYGVTSEQWFDEFNCSQGDSGRVHEILDWLESECPLLMCQYRESGLKEKIN